MSTSLLRRALLVPLLAVLAMVAVVLAPPASAHDVLTGSNPADGAQLDAAPDAIVLTFNNALLDSAQAVLVTDAAGATVAEGSPEIDGSNATLPLPELSGGEYAVAWSVVSSDGHRIDGDFSFSVAGGVPAETASPDETAAPGQGATSDAAATPDEMTTPDATATADAEENGTASGLPVWLVVLVTVGIAGAVVALAIRRWREQA